MENGNSDAVTIEYLDEPGADLATWAGRYPAEAGALARARADRYFVAAPVAPEAVLRVESLGLSVLREKRAAYSAATLSSLKSAAEQQGFTPETLAGALAIPVGLFWKLQRRLIAPATVPQRLIEQLAARLDRSLDDIARYLRQPTQLQGALSFKSDETPTAQQESFAVALASDPETTEEMRQAWR